MNRIILLFYLIFCSITLRSQTYVVDDSLSGNVTKYIHLHDSIYRFVSTFNGRTITEGKIINPYLNKHIKKPFKENSYYLTNPENMDNVDLISEYRLTDTCREYDLRGKLIQEVILKPGLCNTIRKFKESVISKEFTYCEAYHIRTDFDSAGRKLSTTATYNKDKQIVWKFVNGKTIKTEYLYDTLRYNYYPKLNRNRTYLEDGKSYHYSEIDPKSHLTLKNGYYTLESGDKEDERFKYDNKKRLIEKRANYENKTSKVKSKMHLINTYDRAGHIIFSESFFDKKGPYDAYYNKNYIFRYNVKTKQVNYMGDDLCAAITISNNGISIRHWNNQYGYGSIKGDSFVIEANQNQIHNVRYRNGKKHQSRLRLKANLNFPLRYNDSNGVDDFIQSLMYQSGLHYEDLYLSGESYSTGSDDETPKLTYYTDTFFNALGHDSAIVIHKGDTSIRYIRNKGQYELDYHDYFVRLAKDFHQCAVGLKNLMDQWIVPAKYTDLTFDGFENERRFYGRKGIYTDIYNWKGELISENLIGLRYAYNTNDYYYYEIVPKSIRIRNHASKKTMVYYMAMNDSLRLYQLVNTEGKKIIEFQREFDVINDQDNENVLFQSVDSSLKVAIFNLSGRITDYKYDWVRKIDSGLYLVSENRKLYFIDGEFKTPYTDKIDDYIKTDSFYYLNGNGDTIRAFNLYTRKTEIKIITFKIGQYQENSKTFNITDKTEKHHGIANADLSIKIKPEYKEISKFENFNICKKQGVYDIYDSDWTLLNTIVADTIYNLWQLSTSHNHYNKLIHPLIFKKGHRYGILNEALKVTMQPIYENILNCTDFWMLCNVNDTAYCGLDYKPIKPPFPTDKYIYFYSELSSFNQFPRKFYYEYENQQSQTEYGLMNNKGQIVAFPVNFSGHSFDRFDLSLIYYNNAPQFLIDIEGNVKKYLRKFKKFHAIGEYFYFQDNNELSGVMGRDGNYIVKPEHQFLGYDAGNQLVWYNCMPGQMHLYNYKSNNNIWQVKSLRTGVICKDTFESPTHFLSEKCLLKNNHGLYGVIDTSMKQVIPFEYTEIYELYTHICFVKKDSILITDYNFKKLKSLYLTYMNHAENVYWGYVNGKSYLYDSAFNLIDSSTSNFSNSDRKLKIDEYTKITLINHHLKTENIKKDGSIYERDDEDEDVEMETSDRVVPETIENKKINNTLAILLAYNKRRPFYNNYTSISYFPYPSYENQYSDHYYDFDNKLYSNDLIPYTIALNTKVPVTYTPNYIRIDQFMDEYIEVINYTGHFISYEYNEHPYEELIQKQNLYVDERLGFAYINLNDLIDPNKKDEFNKIIYNKLSQLDDPGIPCYPKTDYLEMFSSSFVITSNGLIFYMNNSTYHFKVDVHDLKPFFRDYWKDKF